ncbi:phage tail assembly chaperone G [Enterococcus innesii]|uniref:phage tail assembly chaperone G n=1 Tax=Enterococcus innesii TaxID=2839759 RepID=UPI003B5BA0E8
MTISISFKIDGKMHTFKKDDIYFSDNIRAVKHTIVQSKFYNGDDPTPEKYEEMQEDFCEMMADIFNNEFSSDQFKRGLSLSSHKKAEEIFTQALGGKIDKEDKEKK